MIIPEDESTIQQMLGTSDIPERVHTEYLRRVRFLHRVIGAGPMGPIAILDMLRFLDLHPPDVERKHDPSVMDWREVEPGTPVHVRRAGHWTRHFEDHPCRFQGFVEAGTLAVEMPSGKVDEFNKADVKLVQDDLPEDLDGDSFRRKQGEEYEPDARAELWQVEGVAKMGQQFQEGQQGGNGPGKEQEPDPIPDGDTMSSSVDDSEINSGASESSDIGDDDEPPPLDESAPEVKWSEVQSDTPVWFTDGEDVRDAKFVRTIPGGRAKIAIDGEESERTVNQKTLVLAS